MAQVVNAHICNASPLANTPPWRLEVGEMGSSIFPSDDPGVAFDPFDFAEHLQCWCADMDGLRAGLGIRQVDRRALKIDVIPLEGHDLGQSAPGENQKAQGIDG